MNKAPKHAASIHGRVSPVTASCANCGATLSGRYCSQCGQDRQATPSVRHFFDELIEGLLHLDSTLWRTLLPLLFKPGEVTERYLSGKRKSYMPPVRTYLVLSIVYFLLLSASNTAQVNIFKPDGRQFGPQDCAEFANGAQWLRRVVPDLEGACLRAHRDHGSALVAAMSGLLPKVMFVMLPLVALVQYWIYRRERPWYVDHLTFVLHFQSFFFFVGSIALLLTMVASGLGTWLDTILYAWAAVYLFVANRRVYRASPLKAALSILALAVAYTVFWAIGASFAGMYAFVQA